ncbi:MAG TPA: dienelactone hydrolase family protein [Pseudonocardiaceae bacterium]|nr:dienelactone hydrolase family protein [Pseudonocardiaceae bacterium]
MCDDTPLHRSAGDRPRQPHERLGEDELTTFGPHSAGIVRHPGTSGPAPLVVVAPERYGLVQHTVDVAEGFAKAGYVAISPDFYIGVQETETHRLPELPDEVVLRHIVESVDYAGRDQRVNIDRIGCYGVCRSGSWGLLAEQRLPAVKGVIMLYGGAQPREWSRSANRTVSYEDVIGSGRAPVLGIFGERDHTMSITDVTRLRDAFERHDRGYDISIVRDMPHGWINDTMPGRYRAEQAELVWSRMLAFLDRTVRATDRVDDVEWTFRSRVGADYDFTANRRQE